MTNKILFLDDDESILDLLKHVFDRKGYEIYIASDPLEAINLISKVEFSVITIDLLMPKINGHDFLRSPEVSSSKAIKIVISALLEVEGIVKIINCGLVWRYIQKPFKNEELLQAVSNAVDFYQEKKEKEKYYNEMISSKKEIEDLNKNLNKIIEDRMRISEGRSQLLKRLATTDEQEVIIGETIKLIEDICGNLNFRIVKEKPADLMFYPLMSGDKRLGYIVFDEIKENQLEKITDVLQGFAPIVELCLTLLNAKSNADSILNELNYLNDEA